MGGSFDWRCPCWRTGGVSRGRIREDPGVLPVLAMARSRQQATGKRDGMPDRHAPTRPRPTGRPVHVLFLAAVPPPEIRSLMAKAWQVVGTGEAFRRDRRTLLFSIDRCSLPGSSAACDWAVSHASTLGVPRSSGWGRLPLCRRGRCCLQEQKPTHVAGDVGEADPGAGSGDADAADEQAHAMFLVGEDMLDAGPFP